MREARQDTRRQKSLYQAEDVLPSINAPQRTAQVGKPSVQIGIEHWMVVGENAHRQRVGQSVVLQKLLAGIPPNHAREQQDQQRGPTGVDDCAQFYDAAECVRLRDARERHVAQVVKPSSMVLPRDVNGTFASHQEPIDQVVAKHKRCAEKGDVPQDMNQVDRVARESHGIAKHIRDGREHPKDARDHQHVAILF